MSVSNYVSLGNRGVFVTVKGRDKARDEYSIKGWLVGEIPQGLLISLDMELRDVRLVSDCFSISYNYDDVHKELAVERAEEIEEKLNDADSKISPKLKLSLSKLRFSKLHDLCHLTGDLISQISHVKYDMGYWRNKMPTYMEELLPGFLMARADKVIDLHKEVYDLLDEVELIDILSEYGNLLSSLPPEFVIPADDLRFSDRESLISTLTNSKNWNRSLHRKAIDHAQEIRENLILDSIRSKPQRDDVRKDETYEKPYDDSTLLSRWFSPSLRILAGTGLVGANAALGITAGLTSTIATLGATAVPTYVGVATSIYTGTVQAAEGLAKIGRAN